MRVCQFRHVPACEWGAFASAVSGPALLMRNTVNPVGSRIYPGERAHVTVLTGGAIILSYLSEWP